MYSAIIEMNIEGMTKSRAEQITRFICSKAKAVIDNTRCMKLGLTEAIWMHSGAPCEVNPRKPTGQNAAHIAVDGKRYKLSEGMCINGKYVLPGYEDGCRCTSRSVILGFED